MNLAKRDIEIKEILEHYIENRKKLMKNNHKELEIAKNKNKYLIDIFNDYEDDLDVNKREKTKAI